MGEMDIDRQDCIGVIGLGAMGGGIALRLMEQGFPVIGFDIDPERNRNAETRGARIAGGPAEVTRHAARVICMVDTSSQIEDVILGPDGVCSVAGSGDVLLCMSTVDLASILKCSEALSRVGAVLVDAPVSGGAQAAKDGRLSILVGATESGLEASQPVLRALAESYFHMGDVGSGFAMKMVNNILFHTTSVAIIEAMALGTRAGLDPQQMFDVLGQSTGDSVALRMRVPRFLSRDFEGVPLRVAYREMVMETGFGRLKAVPTPLASMAEQVHLMGMVQGLGDKDGSALVKIYEAMAGVLISNGKPTAYH